MEKQTEFSTSDIKVASFLLSQGISLIGVDRTNKKVAFVFEKSERITKLIQSYLADKATVNPRLLFASFDHLKSVIYGEIEI